MRLGAIDNAIVHVIDSSCVLDLQQLRDVTLDDPDLMREILTALMEDTSAQVTKLASAIEALDSKNCEQLAHYCKGACSNVGANAAAEVFRQIELDAKAVQFQKCAAAMTVLGTEMERLRLAISEV